ncbi:MAG TPA: hypothetical protein VIL16_19620 [Trebonia sp.]
MSAHATLPGVSLKFRKIALVDGRVIGYLGGGGWVFFDTAADGAELEAAGRQARLLHQARDEALAVREHASAVSP